MLTRNKLTWLSHVRYYHHTNPWIRVIQLKTDSLTKHKTTTTTKNYVIKVAILPMELPSFSSLKLNEKNMIKTKHFSFTIFIFLFKQKFFIHSFIYYFLYFCFALIQFWSRRWIVDKSVRCVLVQVVHIRFDLFSVYLQKIRSSFWV